MRWSVRSSLIAAVASRDAIGSFGVRLREQIVKGIHKGLMGQVVEATDTHVKVELHSKLKKVFISRNQVRGDIMGDPSYVLAYFRDCWSEMARLGQGSRRMMLLLGLCPGPSINDCALESHPWNSFGWLACPCSV